MPFKKLSEITIKLRNRHFFIIDVITFCFTPILSLFLRFDGRIELITFDSNLLRITILFIIIKITTLFLMGLYRRFWQLASIDELARLIIAGTIITLLEVYSFGLSRTAGIMGVLHYPASLPWLDSFISLALVASSRFSIRAFIRINQRLFNDESALKVLIVGAGEAGIQVVSEIQKNPQLKLMPVGFVDDDTLKRKLKIRGLKVLGDTNQINQLVKLHGINKIIIAMPTASGGEIRRINSICLITGIPTQTLPGVYEIIDGKININKLRNIKIEDLLRREPVTINNDQVKSLFAGKTVLITGAGGSIGSELVRQIYRLSPNRLLILGHGENSIFEIEQEIRLKYTTKQISSIQTTEVIPIILDVREFILLDKIFSKYNPDIVIHAAAHKHVPLVEMNSNESIKNNILGTKNIVELCSKHSISRFVMISTDKAVNSSSIMGATKRISEMLVLNEARKKSSLFSVVRFGNVLGSRGSVIKTFKRQLEEGSGITLTHPDITRFFMTIPEAVQLVLQAASLSRGSEIFVLDMGEPIKIFDLAKDMIRLSGITSNEESKILITGLRPGEKLFEELFIAGEKYDKTSHEKIMIARNASQFIPEGLADMVDDLLDKVDYLSKEEILSKLKSINSEFKHLPN